jgi:hypothetical protein
VVHIFSKANSINIVFTNIGNSMLWPKASNIDAAKHVPAHCSRESSFDFSSVGVWPEAACGICGLKRRVGICKSSELVPHKSTESTHVGYTPD